MEDWCSSLLFKMDDKVRHCRGLPWCKEYLQDMMLFHQLPEDVFQELISELPKVKRCCRFHKRVI